MAEQGKLPIPALPETAYTTKQGRPRKTLEEKKEAKRIASRKRQESCKTRIYIGAAFDRWKNLKESKGFKSDAELASLLLDCYERHCPMTTSIKAPRKRPPPPSALSKQTRSSPERDGADSSHVQPLEGENPAEETAHCQVEVSVDFEDETCEDEIWKYENGEDETYEDMPLSSSEEDVKREIKSEDETNYFENHVPHNCVFAGGDMNAKVKIENDPEVSFDDSIHDGGEDG